MKIKNLTLIAFLSVVFFSCGSKTKKSTQVTDTKSDTIVEKTSKLPLIDAKAFTDTIDGKPVSLYTLESGKGLTMQITNFGGRVITFFAPDKNGKEDDIVIGYDSLNKYVHNPGERFLGATVGRYANRIAKGKFKLNGKTYTLPAWNHGQCLHGGTKGFDMNVWTVDNVTKNQLVLSLVSPDGDQGFPGTMKVTMTYTLTPENEFKVTYSATTDKPTVINLSHHSFWNLKGSNYGTITDNVLWIKAKKYTPVDAVAIPLGPLASVDKTPFDFNTPTAIGARINTPKNVQLKNGKGYDHNWVLDRKSPSDVELVASLYEPASGRFMEILTDQPGLQFYSGNFMDGSVAGKYGKTINYRESLALETQHFPDSPNQPKYPSTVLNPGQTYTQTCIYKFTTK